VTPVDWSALIALVPQAGLVLLFMWYSRERDKEWMASQERRDKEWRDFLRSETEERRAGSDRRDLRLDAMMGLISATNALITQHDLGMRDRASAIDKSIIALENGGK
jgi:hypothetical protein